MGTAPLQVMVLSSGSPLSTSNRPVESRYYSGLTVISVHTSQFGRPVVSKEADMVRWMRRPYDAKLSGTPMPRHELDVVNICRTHGSSIMRRCMAILGSRAEAEDATQEVFVTLLEKGCQFRAEAEVSSWIYRITTNLCLNRLRGNQRRLLRDDSEQVADWSNIAPSDPYKQYEAKSEFVDLMNELDELDQCIFVFRFLDGLSQEEIAGVTRKSRRTVGKRVRRLEEYFSKRRSEAAHA